MTDAMAQSYSLSYASERDAVAPRPGKSLYR